MRVLGDELQKFISGRGDVDFNGVSKDLEMLLYSTAKRLGRKIDRDCASELLSRFMFELWSKKTEFPISIEHCYSFSKRLVYSTIDQNYKARCTGYSNLEKINQGGRLAALDFRAFHRELNPVSVNGFQFCKEDTISVISKLPLHEDIRACVVKIVDDTDLDTLVDIAKTGSLLGHILTASFLSSFNFTFKRDNRSIFPFTFREEEVMLGCTLIKIPEKWVLPTYILMRDGLFLTVMSFMDSVLAPGLGYYFTNILLSVRVFCVMEEYRKSKSEEEAIKDCGHRFSIRFRDVKNRTGRIERLFVKYDQRAQQVITTIKRNFGSFYRSEKHQ